MFSTYFDKIYVINLKEAIERRKKIKIQFQKLQTDYMILDAYDKLMTKEYLKKINKFKYSFNKSIGWWNKLGCKISHIECLNDAIKNKYKNILILEDDVIFRKGFKKYFPIYIQQLPKDWSIFMLGYYIKNKAIIANQNVSYKISDNIYTLTESHGAHSICYNIKSNGFKKYYDALTKSFLLNKHYDLEIHEICNKLDIKRYAAYPQFTAQANGMSYISNRIKSWNLQEKDERYDLLKSGTVYKNKWHFVKKNKLVNNKFYFILLKGKEYKAKFNNDYFIIDNKQVINNIIYYREI